jgi:hypothetical protein
MRLLTQLPAVASDLEAGAIVVIEEARVRIRSLPVDNRYPTIDILATGGFPEAAIAGPISGHITGRGSLARDLQKRR